MFSGIVNGYTAVSSLTKKDAFQTFSVALSDELRQDLQQGASVAIDGVCMTVTQIDGSDVFFDAMKETLERTTIGDLQQGSQVNVERSLKYGDEIGGHEVSGHVHGTATIVKIDKSAENNCAIYFAVPPALMKYLFPKGYVSLNGTSLTLVEVDKTQHTISVYFIPETLRKTTFGLKQVGDAVNIEIDTQTRTVVDTVERCLADKAHPYYQQVGGA